MTRPGFAPSDNCQLIPVHSCLMIRISNEYKRSLHISVIFRAGNEENLGSPEKFSRVGRCQDPSRHKRGEIDPTNKNKKYTPCLRRGHLLQGSWVCRQPISLLPSSWGSHQRCTCPSSQFVSMAFHSKMQRITICFFPSSNQNL